MATCKDCIYCYVCECSTPCVDFEDQSLYIKLPCKIGSEVAVIRSRTSNGKNLYITNERISHYRVFADHVMMCFDSERLAIPDYRWNDVFAGENAREDAEAALKMKEEYHA